MTRREFEEHFRTEEQCQKYLFNKKWADGFICPKCEQTECFNISSRNLYQCKLCNHQASVTAGTIMDKTRTPLTCWFLAIFLMINAKVKITTKYLKTILNQNGMGDRSYNTVWTIHHRIQTILKEKGTISTFDEFFESEGFRTWRSK